MANRALPRPLKIAVLALLVASVATPCSFDTTPIDFFATRPDFPIDRYVDGHLGILQPTYARSHLVVAYRYLSGNPPSEIEREGFRAVLRHRLQEDRDDQLVDPVRQWENLRKVIRGDRYKQLSGVARPSSDGYSYFINCTDDAFANASMTLASRMKTFGATNPAVMRWLDAQETVFANCEESEPHIPADDPTLPPAFRADRRYQIAAANFYALNWEDARPQFLAIARDPQSPWQKIARLVAARTLIRSSNLGGDIIDADPLARADEELRAILADQSMASLHDAARDLLAVTRFRRAPAERLRETVRGISGGAKSARRVRTDFSDYTLLLDQDVKDDSDLTDWIRTVQSGNVAHAIERWKATKKQQWLVASLMHVKPDDAAVPALLEASASSAQPTIVHHRARLLLAANREDDARTELDRTLARELPASARNQLLAERRGVARTLADFLRDVPMQPVGEGEDAVDPSERRPALPPDAAAVLNYWTPLKTLQIAAKEPSLPDDIRMRIESAASTRATLLGKPDFDDAYAFAQSDGMSPYVVPLDEEWGNWWCANGRGAQLAESTRLPTFLAATKEIADAEREKLASLGSGATWILRTTIARAKSHPDDPRVPEALSLAILGTRRACGDAETEKLAQQAFGILHRKYSKTQWAQDTPYWYKPY